MIHVLRFGMLVLLASSVRAESVFMTLRSTEGGWYLVQVERSGAISGRIALVGMPFDAQPLPDGHWLIAYKDLVHEIDAAGVQQWSYRAPEQAEVYSARRLPDGVIEVGMSHPGGPRLKWIGQDGSVQDELVLEARDSGSVHGQTRKIVPLANDGPWLYSRMFSRSFCEVARDGTVLRTYPIPCKYAWDMQRLGNGHTLLACCSDRQVLELDAAGKETWRLQKDDLAEDGVSLLYTCSIQRLTNGNTLLANWNLHIKEPLPAQPLVLEVTPEKRVSWRFGPVSEYDMVTWSRCFE